MGLRNFIDDDSSHQRGPRNSLAAPPKPKNPQEKAQEFAAWEAANKARAERELADGTTRKQTLLDALQCAESTANRKPFMMSYVPALEGFPLHKFPSPTHAIQEAQKGNWAPAEAWGQELAECDGKSSSPWMSTETGCAKKARACPRGAK